MCLSECEQNWGNIDWYRINYDVRWDNFGQLNKMINYVIGNKVDMRID